MLALAFIAAFAYGIGTMTGADSDYDHTSGVVSDLDQVELALGAAVSEGRDVLFSKDSSTDRLTELREKALERIDILDRSVSQDSEQQANVSNLKRAFLYRTQLQDEQRTTSSQRDGTLKINVETGQSVIKSMRDLEAATSLIRNHELSNLFQKDLLRTRTQWRVTYLMILFMISSMALATTLFVYLIRELRFRQSIADKLRTGMHLSDAGAQLFGESEIAAMLRIIEEGEAEIVEVRRGQ